MYAKCIYRFPLLTCASTVHDNSRSGPSSIWMPVVALRCRSFGCAYSKCNWQWELVPFCPFAFSIYDERESKKFENSNVNFHECSSTTIRIRVSNQAPCQNVNANGTWPINCNIIAKVALGCAALRSSRSSQVSTMAGDFAGVEEGLAGDLAGEFPGESGSMGQWKLDIQQRISIAIV